MNVHPETKLGYFNTLEHDEHRMSIERGECQSCLRSHWVIGSLYPAYLVQNILSFGGVADQHLRMV